MMIFSQFVSDQNTTHSGDVSKQGLLTSLYNYAKLEIILGLINIEVFAL